MSHASVAAKAEARGQEADPGQVQPRPQRVEGVTGHQLVVAQVKGAFAAEGGECGRGQTT